MKRNKNSDEFDYVNTFNNDNTEEEKQVDTSKVKKEAYAIGILKKIPPIVRVLFCKFWAGAAICYFVMMGLFINTTDQLDVVLIFGIFHGLFTDLIVNGLFKMWNSDKREYDRYMMLSYKKNGDAVHDSLLLALFLVLNVIYSIVLTLFVANLWTLIVSLITHWGWIGESTAFGIEPLSLGLLITLIDIIFVEIKNYIAKIASVLKKP